MSKLKNWFGLKCKIGRCECVQESDFIGIWARCISCGKKSAYVSRKVMRSYMELCDKHKEHLELVKSEDKNDTR